MVNYALAFNKYVHTDKLNIKFDLQTLKTASHTKRIEQQLLILNRYIDLQEEKFPHAKFHAELGGTITEWN